MKRFKVLACLAIFSVAVITPANAANCPISTYQSLANQATRLARPMARCEAELRRRSLDVKRMCAVCGPVFVSLSRFERSTRRNKACFSDDRKMMRSIAEFSAMRDDLRFLRRGCGY